LPFIYGTLLSSLVGMFIAVPLGIGAAIYLAELAPFWARSPIGFLIELLAAVPSVVYGLWGIFVLAPFLRNWVEPLLDGTLGVLPYGRSGLVGAVLLGLGRALGETMAVTMVIGNRPEIAVSLFAPGYTMASVLANEFTEATSDVYLSALVYVGLLLLAVTVMVNSAARVLVWTVGGSVKRIRE